MRAGGLLSNSTTLHIRRQNLSCWLNEHVDIFVHAFWTNDIVICTRSGWVSGEKGPVFPAGMSHPAHQQFDSWRRMACRLLSGTDLQEQNDTIHLAVITLVIFFLWIELTVAIYYVLHPYVTMWGCVYRWARCFSCSVMISCRSNKYAP